MKTYSKLFLKLGLPEFEPGLVLNLFFISDKNPGWVSYKRVCYEKKCISPEPSVADFTMSKVVLESLRLWPQKCWVGLLRCLFWNFVDKWNYGSTELVVCYAAGWCKTLLKNQMQFKPAYQYNNSKLCNCAYDINNVGNCIEYPFIFWCD